MRKRSIRITRGFVIAIVIVLAFGWLFSAYTGTLSEDRQEEVLIKAIPFVAVFVSIVLVFAWLIVIVAVVFEGNVPQRTYRPIEGIIIAGILLGVVGLFQGWKLFAYEIGFLILLISLLAFMVWSHLRPMTPRESRRLPPLTQQAYIAGAVVAIVVWALVAFVTISETKPQEPYGLGKTLWDFKTDEEKAEIRDEAESDYRNSKIPLLMFAGLLPAGIVFFGVREIAAALVTKSVENPVAAKAQAHRPVNGRDATA